MTNRWLLRDPLSLRRALVLRWRTRAGFEVSETPAFDDETHRWFRERIGRASNYIEFGSGASTRLAACGGVRTISMESDPRYASAVRATLPADAPVTVLDADIGMTENWGYPVATRPTATRLHRWLGYVTRPLAAAQAQGWAPDLVLVDGRFRAACALAAALNADRAAVPADILFDDYAGRPYYRWIEEYLGAPEEIGRAALFTVGTAPASTGVNEALIARAACDFR